ncbi:NAD(P)H oxidoreductase [Nocardioides sp. KIGAM211]|uniref:NAD(P)H oxidoreductase n=1 Tax=Nocardioides luti TaxID=2761101 RepID=A0A7X0VBV8_9ACTN|nr:NAD(P)H oxidoreductase [Nocardioides luti]
MTHVHLVWTHPRTDSLTAAVVDEMSKVFVEAGATVDVLDLYRAGFDPVLGVDDEPHWEDPDWTYTAEAEGLAERVKAADLVFIVFPVWWYSLPAMAKGYIDRVWNYRLLYGEGHRISAAVRWVGLVGWPEHALAKRGFDDMMVKHLNSGIAGFCGVEDTRVHLLFDSLGDPDVARFRKGARDAAMQSLAAVSDVARSIQHPPTR